MIPKARISGLCLFAGLVHFAVWFWLLPDCFPLPSVRDFPGGVLFVFLNSLYLVPVLSAGYLFFVLIAIVLP
ncbi:MAG TPA: hypothetical protein VF450_25575 [Noviherbaspirillum sp.]